jgi:hypothetical protein
MVVNTSFFQIKRFHYVHSNIFYAAIEIREHFDILKNHPNYYIKFSLLIEKDPAIYPYCPRPL